MFYLLSLDWGFRERLTIVHGITSEPENGLSNVLYRHFRQSPTIWLQHEYDTFLPLSFGVDAMLGQG